MSPNDVARAWRDPKYRRSLAPAAQNGLPENPAGRIELTDEELKVATGGYLATVPVQTTAWMCTLYTFLNSQSCGCGPITTAPMCTLYSYRKQNVCGCP